MDDFVGPAAAEPAHPAGRVHWRPALTRRDVLVTALRLIDDDGVEALSMRRLGKALGRDPMRLYRFAASKDELLDGVVELVLAELEIPTADDSDWQQVLRRTGHAFRRLTLAHPHVVPLLVTRPLATPLAMRPLGTLRPLEALLELLVGAGFDARGALHAYRLYMGFLQGHVLNELQERVHDPEETDDILRLGLHRLPAREFPRLRSLGAELVAYNGAAELDEGPTPSSPAFAANSRHAIAPDETRALDQLQDDHGRRIPYADERPRQPGWVERLLEPGPRRAVGR